MILIINSRTVAVPATQAHQAICTAFKRSQVSLADSIVSNAALRVVRGESVTLGGITVRRANSTHADSLPTGSAPCTIINGYRVNYICADKYRVVTPDGCIVPSITGDGVRDMTKHRETATRNRDYESIVRALRASIKVLAEMRVIECAMTKDGYRAKAVSALGFLPAIKIADAYTQYASAKDRIPADTIAKLWADAYASFDGWRAVIAREVNA